jgi:hypothetical protein
MQVRVLSPPPLSFPEYFHNRDILVWPPPLQLIRAEIPLARTDRHLSLKFLIGPSIISSAFCCPLLLCCISLDAVAQNQRRSRHQEVLPQVGTIKDYPATGLMTGCGNLYAYPLHRTNPAPEAYVFLSRGDGSNAWINLDGRDLACSKSHNRQVLIGRGGSILIA